MRSFGRNSGAVTRRLRHAGPNATDAIACCTTFISWSDPRIIVARCYLRQASPVTWYVTCVPNTQVVFVFPNDFRVHGRARKEIAKTWILQ